MGSYGFLWIPMDSYVFLCIPIDFLWIPMGSHGFFMDSYGLQRISMEYMDSCGFLWPMDSYGQRTAIFPAMTTDIRNSMEQAIHRP